MPAAASEMPPYLLYSGRDGLRAVRCARRGFSIALQNGKGGGVTPAAFAPKLVKSGQSAIGRTLPSLTRFSTTVWAIAFGTASYCLKIIVNEPRPCVTVRIAFE